MPEEEQAASEPCLDEAKLRIVMSTLADMHLEGVPVAVTTGKKRRRYFDGNGREIGKDSALCTMGGLIWHVSPMMDPLRSSLRCCGRFISLQDAQSIVAGSKAGGAPTTAQELAGLHVPLRRYAVCRLTFMAVFLLLLLLPGLARHFSPSAFGSVFLESSHLYLLEEGGMCARGKAVDLQGDACSVEGLPTPPSLLMASQHAPVERLGPVAHLALPAESRHALSRDREAALSVAMATSDAKSHRLGLIYLLLRWCFLGFIGAVFFDLVAALLTWEDKPDDGAQIQALRLGSADGEPLDGLASPHESCLHRVQTHSKFLWLWTWGLAQTSHLFK